MTDPEPAATAIAPGDQPSPEIQARSFHWTFGLVFGLCLFGMVVLIGIFAPFFLSSQANDLSDDAGLGPSAAHWFGTDDFGRDMFARSLVATRLTLIMTFAATAISAVLGILIGAAIWFAPRRGREAGLRAIEIAVSYPGLLVALIITAILGAGATAVVIGIGIAGIPSFARIAANLASDVSRREFVVTAQLMGVSRPKIIARHVLPNISEPLLVVLASAFAVSLMEISGLSFVGLGVQSPSYDFGKLLIDGLPAIYTQPSQVFGPALMIVLTILGAMLIGDGLAAAANPRSRSRMASRRGASAKVASKALLAQDAKAFVSVENLTVTTSQGVELLHGVSFVINRGEILGVVGESGSGKSLTAMAIAQLTAEGLEVEAQRLTVGDLDMTKPVARQELARAVALVYQDPGTTFNPALRMGGQLTEVLRTHMGLSKVQARERILEGLRSVHMTMPEKRLNQHPHELSGGMRQRAMIASALVTSPDLIIADEPTTALDVTVQVEILREFKRINRDRSMSMMFVSHDIGVVEALCDRVLVMKNGEIVEELTQEQLLSRDTKHPYTKALIAATPGVDRNPRTVGAKS